MNQGEPQAPKKPILYTLDDDPSVLDLIALKMASEFEVHTFEQAHGMLQASLERQPTLILLDLHMPNLDGYEVLSVIKSHPILSQAPVFCMSGDDNPQVRDRIMLLGAAGFVRKPFNPKTLLADVLGLLQTLNVRVLSEDGRFAFHIGYNDRAKNQLIHQAILSGAQQSDPMVYLGWTPGAEFLTEFEKSLVNDEKLIYLQIKPALIVKFSYLQDLSPVFHEISSFLPDESNGYHLIFDEVRNIINVYETERALAKTYTLANLLNLSFKRVTLASTLPSRLEARPFLYKMARILVKQEVA